MESPVKRTRIRIIKTVLSLIVVCLAPGCSSEVNFGGTGEIGCPPPKFKLTDKKEVAGNDEQKFNADMAKLQADLKEFGEGSKDSSLNCTL